MRKLLTLGLLLGLGLQAGRADDKADLQGTWLATSYERGGQAIEGERLQKTKLVIKEDMAEFFDGRDTGSPATITLDPGKKPKTLDVTIKQGGEERKLLAIYELQGDTLKLCWAAPGKDRPKEFTTKDGAAFASLVFKRMK
jgi:uncharacterized protein (TIGR03067 family)